MSKKTLLLTTLFLPLFFQCFAQTNAVKTYATRLDLRTFKKVNDRKMGGEAMIRLLVKGDLGRVKAVTEKLGGVFKFGYNNIASVQIPEKNLDAFSKDAAVRKIQGPGVKGVALIDSARIRDNIDSAQFGIAPLSDSLLGTNVLIGVIDGGIYWRHRDFQNPDGTTRIRYIWDQNASGANPPLPYNYGNEWSWQDINNGNCTEIDPPGDFGHGTCVTGIAAGNSLSTFGTPYQSQLRGAAPEAQIIFVTVSTADTAFLTAIADAVDYIFKKADALGMPCVINISQGTYYGSHDGIDLTTQMIESLLDQEKGRVLVAAAGNAGNIRMHLSYSLPSDSNNPGFTLFKYNATVPGLYFDFWSDTANFNNAWFSIGCNDTFANDLGHLAYINIPQDYVLIPDSEVITEQPLFMGGTWLGDVEMGVVYDEGRYHVEFLITPGENNYLWRLQMYGSGTFDLWSTSNAVLGSSDMVDSISTGDSLNPHAYILYPNYYHPDSLETMVSSWQCSNKVITVGNYSNRAGYLDRDSVYIDLTQPANGGEVVGKIFATSSLGPTRTKLMKPDIVSTGSTTITTGDSVFIAEATAPANRVKVYITKKHQRNGGTSMASPLVAGIAALYLQKRPTATYAEIKQALICTAVADSFTGTVPNYTYGNGKVNAFQALINPACVVYGSMDTACVNYSALANVDTGYCIAKVYGTMDTACINYTANANIDTGGCIAKVYGCTDTTALNYDSAANVNLGCVYPSAINNIINSQLGLQVAPNPFSGLTVFTLTNNGYDFNKGEIQILNYLGEVTDAFSVTNISANYTYQNSKLAPGVYFYRLKADDKILKTGKLVVE